MTSRSQRRRRLVLSVAGLALLSLGACSSSSNLATAKDLAEWVAEAPPPVPGTAHPLVSVRVQERGLRLARRLPDAEIPTAPRVRRGDGTLSGFAARAFDALLPAVSWPPLAPSAVAIDHRPPVLTREVFLRAGTAVRKERHYPVPIGTRALTVARATGEVVAQSYDIPIDAVPSSVRTALTQRRLGAIRRATVELEGDQERLRLELGTGAATRIVRCTIDGSELTRYRVVPARLWAPLPRPGRSRRR